jgi:hypothetical protein
MRKTLLAIFVSIILSAFFVSACYCQDDDTTRNILKNGLLGAGTGAIASGASGGNAGKGALIGAGTGAIGGLLLDAITAPPRQSASRGYSRQAAPAPVADEYYDDQEADYYYEEPPPQESGASKAIKQGLLGAGTGAIAAGASGGNAGTGALVGAGTGVIGGALLDTITQPAPQPRRVYRRPAPRQTQYQQQPYQQQYQPQYQQTTQVPKSNIQMSEEPAGPEGGRKKILKKYDENGKLVSEEEIYY